MGRRAVTSQRREQFEMGLTSLRAWPFLDDVGGVGVGIKADSVTVTHLRPL